jgi:flagellar motor switch/type III secretory pathway protein FliN
VTTRNFILLNRTELRALTDRVSGALARWQREWCAADVRRPEPLSDATPDAAFIATCRWRTGTAANFGVSVGCAATSPDTFISLLVGDGVRGTNGEAAPTAATELERSALEALIASLFDDVAPAAKRTAIEWDSEPPSERSFDRRRGNFAVRLRLGKVDIVVALSAAIVEEFLKAQPRVRQFGNPPTSARAALATQRVVVEVHAGAAQLTIAELASLGVGDVITLDRPLDRPLDVRAANGGAFCSGHLGVRDDRKAVLLTAIHFNEEV